MSKLRIFETFAGIGSQTKALDNIKADYEVVATSEWYTDAIIGYNAIHKNKVNKIDRTKGIKFLENYTLSNDSKKPLTSFKRMSDDKIAKLVSSIKNVNNLGSILDINGRDVPEHDLLTYSFPCQDLSIAVKGKGLSRDSGTRSSLMWEVFRILSEIDKSSNNLPKFLVMENVPAIQNIKYKEGLDHFKEELNTLGYTEHYEITLVASHLGIPQRRKRYFMISLHTLISGGGKNTSFANLENIKKPLKFKLKDIVRKEARYTNREEMYIRAINKRDEGLNKVYTRLGVYPTFAQANIVTGIKHDTIGTVTFSGENSRQRVALIEDEKLRVKEMGGYENIRLMGFDKLDYKRLKAAGISDRKISGLAGNSIVVQQLEEIFKVILEVFNA